MPRPVGEPGATGASAEAHRHGHAAPRNPSANTPESAKTPQGAREYAEANTVGEVAADGTVTGSPSFKKSHRHAEKRIKSIVGSLGHQRDFQAKMYEADKSEAAARKFFEIGPKGIKTDVVKIPKIKTSPEALKHDEHEFKRVLHEAIGKGAHPRQIKLLKTVGAAKVIHDNIVTKGGKVQFDHVKVPKIKPGKQHEYMATVRHDQIKAQQIRQGEKHYTHLLGNMGKSKGGVGGFIDNVTSDPLGNLLNVVAPVTIPFRASGDIPNITKKSHADDAVKLLGKSAFEGLTGKGITDVFDKGIPIPEGGKHTRQVQAGGLSSLGDIRRDTLGGIRTGLVIGSEYLTRPGMAIEAEIAKNLSEGQGLGVFLSREQRDDLAGGANPVEVLLHGHKAKNAMTGKEISEALFGGPQAGLLIDLGTDPTLWFGGGALAGKLGERYAVIASRIEKIAPAALGDTKVANLIADAEKRGDYEGLVGHLEALAKEHDVPLTRLGRTKADKDAIARFKAAPAKKLKARVENMSEARKAAPTIRGKSVYVPGKEMQEAAEDVAQYGLRRQIEPGFQINFNTPFGRHLGALKVRLPKKLADAPIIPRVGKANSDNTRLLVAARKAQADEAVDREFASEHQRLLDELDSIKADPTADKTVQYAAQKNLDTFEEKLKLLKNERRYAIEQQGTHHVSPRELTRKFNNKRFAHELSRLSNNVGRNTKMMHYNNVSRAIKPINGDAKANVRVAAHQAEIADTGSDTLMREVAPLNSKEQAVLDDLRKVYYEMARSGMDAGTLEHAVTDYMPRQFMESDDVFGGLRQELKHEEAARREGKVDFTHHRSMFEMSSLTDRTKLAELIRGISKSPVDEHEALAVAEKWYQRGKVKLSMEDMANAVQRGAILHETQMTDLQKVAYEWANRLKSNDQAVPPLFRDLEQTEGVLKLHPEAFKAHEFEEAPFSGMSSREADQLKHDSAAEWVSRLEDARDSAATPELANDYQLAIDQRRAELEDLRPTARSERPTEVLPPPEPKAPQTKVEQVAAQVEGSRASLAELQRQLSTKKAYNVVLRTTDGKVIKTLPKTYDNAEEAYAAATKVDEEGGLLDDVRVGVKEQPEATAGQRAAVAEQYADEAKKLETLEDEHAKLVKEAPKDEATKVRKEPPPDTPNVPTATADEAGLPRDEELKDFGPNPSEVYLGTLRDFRKSHPGKFPILDPMLANYSRTTREGLRSAFRARWKGFDETVGRSEREAQTGAYRLRDGTRGSVEDIVPDYGEFEAQTPENIVGYRNTKTGEEYDVADITFPERTLVPNSAKDTWYDPRSGKEYVRVDSSIFAAGDSIGKDRLWPAELVRDAKAEFFRMGENATNDVFDDAMNTAFQKSMSMIRFGVTTYFPAYHVRNMVSDGLISLMADPGVAFHPIENAKLAKAAMLRGGKGTIAVKGLGDLETPDFLLMLDSFGIRSNQHLAEFTQIAETGKIGRKTKFGLGPGGGIGSKAQEFSARREDIIRMQTFTQRMRRNGGDAADAMWWTIKHHFDYGDLSQFERRTMRNLFLFYTWYRKNIPLQFMSMITRPGFFSGLANTYIDLAQGATPLNFNWSKLNPMLPDLSGPVPNAGLIPDYMITKLANPTVNWNGHAVALGLGYPWADTNLVAGLAEKPLEGLRTGLSLLNPAFTSAVQLGLRTDLITGRQYDQKEASGFSFLADAAGISLPKDSDGNPVLPWQINVLLGNIPLAGRGSSYFKPNSADQDQGRFNKLFGGGLGTFLTGASVYVSPKEGERLDLAYLNRVYARAGQRGSLVQHDATDAELAEFDKQTKEWAKELNIPDKYLHVVPTLGASLYTSQEDREGFKIDTTGSPLSGGTAKTGIGKAANSTGSIIGGLDFTGKTKEYDSGVEESLDKTQGRYHSASETKAPRLLGESFIPISGDQAVESFTGRDETIDPKQFYSSQKDLRLNQEYKKSPQSAPKLQSRGTKSAEPSKQQRLEHQGKLAQPQAAVHDVLKQHDPRLDDVISSQPKKPQGPKPNKANHVLGRKLSGYGLDPSKVGALVNAAKKYDVPPELLAAIGKVESSNGTSTLPGVHSGQNSAGAAGPFQIGNGTGAAGDWWHENMPATADIYDYNTAAEGAALYLKKAGATMDPSTWHNAALSYNHAEWYANEIVQYAEGASSNLWNKAARTKVTGSGAPYKIVKTRQGAKTVINLADKFSGTQEGSKLQAHWAAESGISSGTAWCSAFLSALMRRVGLPEPDAPAAAGTWQNWKGGTKLSTTDLSKAKPGDILMFGTSDPNGTYADHVGLYRGNGEMTSGNFGDEVKTGPVSEESRPIQSIVRPNYSGKVVKFKINTAIPSSGAASSSGASALGGSVATTGEPGGYHPGRSKQVTNELKQSRDKIIGTATSGGSSSVSLKSLLSPTDVAALGKGTVSARTLLKKVHDELEEARRRPLPAVTKMPKYKV